MSTKEGEEVVTERATVEGTGEEHGGSAWRQRYDEAMELGWREYADVIEQLNELGLPTIFTQTGGMNAALEVQLETGAYLLITDREDTLSWRREDHEGWAVGLYEADEAGDGPVRFESTSQNDFESLLKATKLVLRVGR